MPVYPFAHYRGQEPHDAEKSIGQLLHAVETVLIPLGVKGPQIKEWVKEGTSEVERSQRYSPKKVEYWEPLFEFEERAKVATRQI